MWNVFAVQIHLLGLRQCSIIYYYHWSTSFGSKDWVRRNDFNFIACLNTFFHLRKRTFCRRTGGRPPAQTSHPLVTACTGSPDQPFEAESRRVNLPASLTYTVPTERAKYDFLLVVCGNDAVQLGLHARCIVCQTWKAGHTVYMTANGLNQSLTWKKTTGMPVNSCPSSMLAFRIMF